ncbi:hypothetical protein TNCT_263911 [Trichonephila clavata]|uniref:Uncharacterized protein n=1 Tax=Trichonephila clavata TaxID=2740835 RepID=A0A8X6KF00_TRICU|nr:hypothetical protein TNCT_263911 [Trichonephila clavata]
MKLYLCHLSINENSIYFQKSGDSPRLQTFSIRFPEQLKLPQTKTLFSANLYGTFNFLPSLILLKLLLFTSLIKFSSPDKTPPPPKTNDEEDFERNDQWQKGNQDKVAKWREVRAQGGVRRGGLSGNSCRKSSARLP